MATKLRFLMLVLAFAMGVLITLSFLIDFDSNTIVMEKPCAAVERISVDNTADNTAANQAVRDCVPLLKNWSLIYYQHVRKSGGSTIAKLLRNNGLNANGLRHAYPPQAPTSIHLSFKDIKPKAIALKMDMIETEYFPFYTSSYISYKDELWSDVLMITILRNPLERVFSDLLYRGVWMCSGLSFIYIEAMETPKDMMTTLEQKLIDCAHRPPYAARYTSNIYTKVFSGTWSGIFPEQRLRKEVITDFQLQIAKSILNEFDIVLILELWKQTKLQLKCNGLQNDTLLYENVGGFKHVHNLTLNMFPDLKRELLRLNKFDMELYKFGKEIASRNIERCECNHSVSNLQFG